MKNKLALFILAVTSSRAALDQAGLSLPASFSVPASQSAISVASQQRWYQGAWEAIAEKLSGVTDFISEHTPELGMPSIPTWQDITSYSPSFNMPTFTAESPMQNIALGTAGLLGAYGIYRYHGAYISRSVELIEKELEFIEQLIANPYTFHATKIDASEIEEIDTKLAEHKANIIRALGLTPSFANPKSYLARLYQEELDQITTTFNNLAAISKSVTIRNIREGGEDQSIVINNLSTIYFYLLQALNAYKPETLGQLITKITQDRRYTLSETLRISFPAYMEIRNLGNRLINFKCDPCTTYQVQDITKRSEALLSDIKYRLYGYWIFRYFLSKQKKDELNQLNTLFDRVKENLTLPANARQGFSASVNTFLDTLVDRLPTKMKWAIVKDYLIHHVNESFYLYTKEPEAPEPTSARPQPRPPLTQAPFPVQINIGQGGAVVQQQQRTAQPARQPDLSGYNDPRHNPFEEQ